jgi:arsenate reductase (glutaredoxin)
MKKIYYLGTCSTCKEIMAASGIAKAGYEMQDIKTEPITEAQIEEMHRLAGNYEVLFSKRARKYAEMNLKDVKLTEADMKRLILEEYTFLKRPVVISGDEIFIGSDKNTVQRLVTLVRGD